MEQKRENFRRYLEETGAIENLTKALIKLYEEQEKPEDAAGYILKNLSEQIGAPDPEQVEILKHELGEAHGHIAVLEKELVMIQGGVQRSESEIQLALDNGLAKVESDDCNPFLKNTLTQDLLADIKVNKSKFNGNILDCIQAAFKNCKNESGTDFWNNISSRNIGIVASDHSVYADFKSLFERAIRETQGIDIELMEANPPDTSFNADPNDTNDPNYTNTQNAGNIDPEGNFIISTRIRFSRSFVNYPFNPIMKIKHYEEVKNKTKLAITSLSKELKGEFYNLEEMSESLKKQLSEKHLMFKEHDKYLEAANALRFWPYFRGIFVNEAENLAIWCNEEDHLKIISIEKGGNLGNIK